MHCINRIGAGRPTRLSFPTDSQRPVTSQASATKIMPPVLESDMHSREYLAEQKRKERDATIVERKAAEREALKEIQSLARSLSYPGVSNAQPTQNARGADDRIDSDYEPDAEEEANAEEEVLRDEKEAALAKSKAMHLKVLPCQKRKNVSNPKIVQLLPRE